MTLIYCGNVFVIMKLMDFLTKTDVTSHLEGLAYCLCVVL